MFFDKIFTEKLSIEFFKIRKWIMEFLRAYQCIFNDLTYLANINIFHKLNIMPLNRTEIQHTNVFLIP